jgi:hypothetical protein
MTESTRLLCSICHHEIVPREGAIKGTWHYGNNAEPVNNGRCCDACDARVVIPLRLLQMLQRAKCKHMPRSDMPRSEEGQMRDRFNGIKRT